MVLVSGVRMGPWRAPVGQSGEALSVAGHSIVVHMPPVQCRGSNTSKPRSPERLKL
jgi:hypothetical protein